MESLVALGDYLRTYPVGAQQVLFQKIHAKNAWFTPEQLTIAWAQLLRYLHPNLHAWAKNYMLQPSSSKKVGVVMAGNIPAVGFHDVLCVLVAGHHAQLKLSQKDAVLIPFLLEQLIALEPAWEEYITYPQRLQGVDALIATGRWQTHHYFKHYFGHIPHLIRHERNSCAVLSGEESKEELTALGADIFNFFGMGCRSVSKLYLPKEYSIQKLLPYFNAFESVIRHGKYFNNYTYRKMAYAISGVACIDNGFMLLKETSHKESSVPIAVLLYETYSTRDVVARRLKAQEGSLQTVVCKEAVRVQLAKVLDARCLASFGEAQQPNLHDYADRTDTLSFLEKIAG